jgi:hypothetical protein
LPYETDDALQGGGGGGSRKFFSGHSKQGPKKFSGQKPVKKVKKMFSDIHQFNYRSKMHETLIFLTISEILNLSLPCQSR